MNTQDLLKTYREQTIATTIVFLAIAIFGLVFWKVFASSDPYILQVEENALQSRAEPAGSAVSLRP